MDKEMKVIKIIMDELPEWCYACDFWTNNVKYDSDYCEPDTEPYLCEILDREIDQNIFEVNRPDWCPLASFTRETVYELYDKWAVEQLDKESENK